VDSCGARWTTRGDGHAGGKEERADAVHRSDEGEDDQAHDRATSHDSYGRGGGNGHPAADAVAVVARCRYRTPREQGSSQGQREHERVTQASAGLDAAAEGAGRDGGCGSVRRGVGCLPAPQRAAPRAARAVAAASDRGSHQCAPEQLEPPQAWPCSIAGAEADPRARAAAATQGQCLGRDHGAARSQKKFEALFGDEEDDT
jgi:hypothetical protein